MRFAVLALCLLACDRHEPPAETQAESAEAPRPPRPKPSTAASAPRWQPPRVEPGKARPTLVFDAAKLPPAVVGIHRTVLVEGKPHPPTYRVAVAASYLCKGPPFPSYTRGASPFYGAELLAGDLADAPLLASWLACGAAALEVSGPAIHGVQVRVPDLRASVELRLVARKDLPMPAIFSAASSKVPGLEQLRCLTRKPGDCDAHAQAVAWVDALGVTAIGDLQALTALAAPPVAGDERRREVFARLGKELDGDVMLTADDDPYIELLDTLQALPDHTRKALGEALRRGSAIVGVAIPSDYAGKARVLIDLAAAEDASEVALRLRDHVAELATQPAPQAEPADLFDRRYQAALRAAFAGARVEEKGNVVSLELTLAAPAGVALLEEVDAERGPRIAALASVLELGAAGQPPADADLRALGGEELSKRIAARRTAPPVNPPADAEPVYGLADVFAPKGAERSDAFGEARLRYRGRDVDVIDEMLALLVQKGFTVRLRYRSPAGPTFLATRGSTLLTVDFMRVDGVVIAIHSNDETAGW
jgi:hypothetical protein